MAGLSAGDLDSPIPGAHRQDEVGEMARAVLTFKEHMIRENELAAEHEAVRQQAQTELRRAALVGMANTVEAETGSALEGIGVRTMAMAKTADAMSASATRTGASAQDAATAAAQALANAQTVASAAEQLATSIREISGQVSQSTAVVGRAVAAGSEARTTIEALNQEVERTPDPARAGQERVGLERPWHADHLRFSAPRLHTGGDPRVLRTDRRLEVRRHHRHVLD